ncbi:methionyl-tRNA formyltransferase [Ureaplasma canigenitalium]|uniref:methionyl-tRNA formyltransferase n=1 Tax=Ureaplasma canigenitalium TaxID=42092 RepID=UPI0004E24C6A|nr:methionyl-tRNA formyltransferase [Ureaplasma canigenitalium]
MRVIFFGTPLFAKIVLEKLMTHKDVQLITVVAQPDKELNRKGIPVFQEVKKFCLENNLSLLQPNKISEIYDTLVDLKPDIIITAAYGQFIPTKIINIPKYKIVNVHGSLLPKLRGGAPIHRAIMEGESETGITLMHTIKEMDKGNILFQAKMKILDTTTYHSLNIDLAHLGANLLFDHFNELCDENLLGTVQNESEVTFGYNIKKEETVINFNQKSWNILRFVNGLYDKPMAIFSFNDYQIKVHQVNLTTIKSNLNPGQIYVKNKRLFVATADYDIELSVIQLPNKKALPVKDILNGSRIFNDYLVKDEK